MDMPAAGKLGRPQLLVLAAAWAFLAFLLVSVGWESIAFRRFVDPDDALRLVQVRDLLAGQGWFDTSQYRIDPPDGTPMHWSRLVDLPIAGLLLLLTPLLGQASAETAVLVLVPLLTLGIAMLAIGRVAAHFFRTEVVALAGVLCVLQPIFLAQMRMMRIDHHGWQAALLALALVALLPRAGRIGGWLAGLAMAAGLSISIELLPMTGAIGVVLFVRWLRDPAQRWWLAHYMGGLAVALAVLFVATRGPAAYAPWCDAIAPAHLAFFAIAAAGTWIIAKVAPARPLVLAASFAAAGGAAFATFATIAPNCLAAPFGELDPLVREVWYLNVLEGQPMWKQNSLALTTLLQSLVAIGATVAIWRQAPAETRGWWLEYLLLLLFSILGALLVWRSMAFVAIFATVPLAWMTDRMILKISAAADIKRKLGLAAGLILLLMPGLPVNAFEKLGNNASTSDDGEQKRSKCDIEESVDRLGTLPPQTVFAILDLGPTVLERTHHAVIATGHHRANLAMRDVIRTYLRPEAQARSIVKAHGATLLLFCADLDESKNYAKFGPKGLMADLLAGRDPSWLQRLDLGTPDGMRVYRVR